MSYRFNRPTDETINAEITRLGGVLERHELQWESKRLHGEMGKVLTGEYPDSFKVCEDYYSSGISYLKTKRRFWSQHRDNSMDKNGLEKLQEGMDEWLTNGWAYFGMEHYREETENIKEEFQMFKLMFENTPKKEARKRKK
mgnify:FL=1